MICIDKCRGCIPGLSQKKTGAVGIPTVHQTSPVFYCLYNRGGGERERRWERGKIKRMRVLRESGAGEGEGPGKERGEGTRSRENWNK